MSITFIGIGNPGQEYLNTRHNAGFIFIDRFVEKLTNAKAEYNINKKFMAEVVEVDNFIFIKPQTFMNNSGEAVLKYLSFYKPNILHDLYVVHDDLDIKLGDYKISNKGPKVHKGIISIERKLGKKEFKRIRIGVDKRENQSNISGEDYVLQRFPDDELSVLHTTIDEIIETFVK